MSLKHELIKLAKENPRGIRAHLVPILKEAMAEKLWKLLGECKQTPEGDLILKIALRAGGSAASLWRKFQVAYNQRKLIVTFDEQSLTFMIPKGQHDISDLEIL